MLKEEFKKKLLENATERFLRYVKINTKSDENSSKNPSSENQFVLAELLKKELIELGLENVELDEFCYVYATLPSNSENKNFPISFCAHLDTAPSVSGENVIPIIRENYQGEELRFPEDNSLVLSPKECPALLDFIGDNIITSAGNTLLGADDKAGIASIMAALELLVQNPELKHPEIRICFTPDEEIGRGTEKINIEKLGKICYTIDGGMLGELEDECFNACSVKVFFYGQNYHPGESKNKMINAGAIAARFLAEIPEWEAPEHTEKKEGFYHLTEIKGDESYAELNFILRDFNQNINEKRIKFLNTLKELYEIKYEGLKIEFKIKNQYRNMKEILDKFPEVIEKAEKAMEMAGVKVIRNAIRGGTDGARLCFMGIPTPNIFTGGVLFHSKKEWIPQSALGKAAEVIIYLSELWS